MAYIRSKVIKGHTYYYLQESYRVGSNVKTKSLYLGKDGSGKKKVNKITKTPKDDMKDFDTLPPKGENLDGNEKINTDIEKLQIYGAKTDKRDKDIIARDMRKNSKEITTNKNKWNKNKGKIDLKGWDTTHINNHLDSHKESLQPIQSKLQNIFKGAKVSGRLKALPSLAHKIRKKNTTTTFTHKDSTDLIGVRALFKNEEHLRENIHKLKKDFKVLEERDYIKKPKGAYRAYHLIIQDKRGKKAEIQLKTNNQQKWSDYAHDTVYKDTVKTKKVLGEKGFKEMNDYLKKMSEYYLKLDNGQKTIKPKLPSNIKKHYGEI